MSPLPPFDMHCPIMSLPHALHLQVPTIPNDVPYLAVDAARQAAWEAKLAPAAPLRIGIAWSGSPTHLNDHNRSITLPQLMPLLQAPFAFHAAQRDVRTHEMQLLEQAPNLTIHTDAIDDFTDTAALLNAMDLVITVDTSVAHLAGALGKPVWVLLPQPADYRWELDREDSSWYPTARLFRQRASGDWPSVIARVIEALHALKFDEQNSENFSAIQGESHGRLAGE
jgi:ADP-heptose:LPS heptosyltransferase